MILKKAPFGAFFFACYKYFVTVQFTNIDLNQLH